MFYQSKATQPSSPTPNRGGLPPRWKTDPVQTFNGWELSVKEIGQMLGAPERTVRRLIVQKLRRSSRFSDEGRILCNELDLKNALGQFSTNMSVGSRDSLRTQFMNLITGLAECDAGIVFYATTRGLAHLGRLQGHWTNPQQKDS